MSRFYDLLTRKRENCTPDTDTVPPAGLVQDHITYMPSDNNFFGFFGRPLPLHNMVMAEGCYKVWP